MPAAKYDILYTRITTYQQVAGIHRNNTRMFLHGQVTQISNCAVACYYNVGVGVAIQPIATATFQHQSLVGFPCVISLSPTFL